MTRQEIDQEVARCDAELAYMETHPENGAAYLRVLGMEDWRWERRHLLEEKPE